MSPRARGAPTRKAKRKLLVTTAEATPATQQHKKPCSDCPWRRDSVPGWLGNLGPQEWVYAAHGEARIDCHVHVGAQCAGAATYRSNVAKRPRDPETLVLPSDRERVFATWQEFLEYHASYRGRDCDSPQKGTRT